MNSWLLLSYRVSREPSANRVYVWRKLKRLGAVALQDAVWVLPDTPQTKEQFQWLADEIIELRGEAMLWQSHLASPEQDAELAGRFSAAVEPAYRRIKADLRRKGADLMALSRQYQEALAQDYFHSDLGRQVRELLTAARRRVRR